jgi:iron complex outermembrane recepter protein
MEHKMAHKKVVQAVGMALIALAGRTTILAAPPTTRPTIGPATQPSAKAVALPPAAPNELADLSLEDLMNVEVTSVSKQRQLIGEAPAAITVIGQDDITRSGLGSIPELLRLAPGMSVARVNANRWNITARGFNGPYANNLLVLMDGRSVYTPVYGGVLWSGIDYPLPDLDRIEVIRGPGGTLWGSNAVNGVVNISTKSAEQTQGWMLDTRAGTESSDASVRYGFRVDDQTAARVYVKSRYTDNSALGEDPANDRWSSLQGGFRIDRRTSPKDTLTLQGDAYGQNFDDTIANFFGPTVSQGNLDGQNLLARWTHRESDRSETTLQLYYNRMDLDSSPAGWEENTVDVDFTNRFGWTERQEITWGLGARATWATIESTTSLVIDPTDLSQNMITGFVQDQITLVPDRLQWYIGTKIEYESHTGVDYLPATRLLWTPDSRNSVWAAVSRSVRMPALAEQADLFFPPVFALISGKPEPEHAMSYELGYKTRLTDNLTVDVAVFATRYDDLIVADLLAGTLDNGGSAETYGLELAANWKVSDRWRLAGSYTLLGTFVHTVGGAASQAMSEEVSSPENQFQFHSYYDVTRHLQVNSSLYYVQRLDSSSLIGAGGESVPGYVRLDMSVVWSPRENMRLSAGVQNLLDDRHPESSTLLTSPVPTETERAAFVQFNVHW